MEIRPVNKLKAIFISSLLLTLISQINFLVNGSGFRLSIATIVLAVLLLMNPELNPIYIGGLSGLMIAILRISLDLLNINNFQSLLAMYMPVAFYYFVYGIFFFFIIYRRKDESLMNLFIPLALIDFVSNVIELMLRGVVQNYHITVDTITVITLAALLRSLLTIISYQGLKYYRYLINEEKYRKEFQELIMRISELKGERYLLNKNELLIENIMNEAYSLYEELSEMNCPKPVLEKSLSISKSIHEVKKDYISTIKGLNEMTHKASDYKVLSIYEIFEILKNYLEQEKIEYSVTIDSDIKFLKTSKHYDLVSIFRNLINNANEAMKDIKNPKISVTMQRINLNCLIKVKDNGHGIKNNNMNHIFKPGFSTKYSIETGDVNRGIGLTLVKDIIEKEFSGKIEVKSQLGKGTEFIVTIPWTSLEVI